MAEWVRFLTDERRLFNLEPNLVVLPLCDGILGAANDTNHKKKYYLCPMFLSSSHIEIYNYANGQLTLSRGCDRPITRPEKGFPVEARQTCKNENCNINSFEMSARIGFTLNPEGYVFIRREVKKEDVALIQRVSCRLRMVSCLLA